MKTNVDILIDQSNLLDDVVVHVFLALVEIFVFFVEPRPEHVQVLEEDILACDINLHGKIFVWDGVLDVSHCLEERFFVDGLDVWLKVALNEAYDGVDVSRYRDLEFGAPGNGIGVAQLLELLVARDGVVVVHGLARASLDLLDAFLDLLRRKVLHYWRRVHPKLGQDLRRREKEGHLELDEQLAVSGFAIRYSPQAILHARRTFSKDVFSAREGH